MKQGLSSFIFEHTTYFNHESPIFSSTKNDTVIYLMLEDVGI